MIGAAAVSAFVTVELLNAQHRQQQELRQQRAAFCAAEAQIRAKIAEIEIEIHTYIYVPPAPACRR